MTVDLWNHELPAGPVPAGATLRVALVGCGKAKLAHPAPARELYTGSLFRAARRHVEGAGYAAWWILSARHGLVHPDEIVGPYEATLTGRTNDQIACWARKVDSRMRCSNYGVWSQHGGALVVDVFAGQAYVEPLLEIWTGLSWEIRVPHAGLQIGERLAAFAGVGS